MLGNIFLRCNFSNISTKNGSSQEIEAIWKKHKHPLRKNSRESPKNSSKMCSEKLCIKTPWVSKPIIRFFHFWLSRRRWRSAPAVQAGFAGRVGRGKKLLGAALRQGTVPRVPGVHHRRSLPHANSLPRRHDSQIRNMGHCRARKIPQPGPHVLQVSHLSLLSNGNILQQALICFQGCAGCNRGIWHHESRHFRAGQKLGQGTPETGPSRHRYRAGRKQVRFGQPKVGSLKHFQEIAISFEGDQMDKKSDLPRGQINDLSSSGKPYSLPSFPATPLFPSRTLEGFFELTQLPSLLPELQRINYTVRCGELGAQVQGPRQEQLSQTSIVRWLKHTTFRCSKNWAPLAPLRPPWWKW